LGLRWSGGRGRRDTILGQGVAVVLQPVVSSELAASTEEDLSGAVERVTEGPRQTVGAV